MLFRSLEGRWQGPFRARFQARQLDAQMFRNLLAIWGQGRGAPALQRGRAADLGDLVFDTLGSTLDAQLLALGHAREESRQRSLALNRPQGLGPLLSALQTSRQVKAGRASWGLGLCGWCWQRWVAGVHSCKIAQAAAAVAAPVAAAAARCKEDLVPRERSRHSVNRQDV